MASPRKGRKAEKRLSARLQDFARGSAGKTIDRQGSRWASGGFHKPGSNKK